MSAGAKDRHGDELTHRYRVLRRVLATNSELLELMADLEADLALLDPCQPEVRHGVLRLLDGSLLLAEDLDLLTGGRESELYQAHARVEAEVRSFLQACDERAQRAFVLRLAELDAGREQDAGGKAARLAELRAARPDLVPAGFVLTTAAYRAFLDRNALHQPIRALSRDLDLLTGRNLFRERTAAVRALVGASPLPEPVLAALRHAIAEHPGVRRWAVRSSAVGEDGQMSFAGQFDSLLDVPPEEVPAACVKVFASRWNDRAVLYRLYAGVAEVETPMAVLIIPMVEARRAGVLYTRDPADPTAELMIVDWVDGLADAMVRGEATATSVVLRRQSPGEEVTPGSALPARVRAELAHAGLAIESLFGRPQDVEWVESGDGRIVIVQSRALRTEERAAPAPLETSPPLLAGGMTIFPGRATGPVHVALDPQALAATSEGAVLVVPQATPELAAVLGSVGGLIAEQGNPAGHAAALVREFAVPAIFGLSGAAAALEDGMQASLDATQRKVYAGVLWPEVRERVRTRIRHASRSRGDNVLHRRILALTLVDPLSSRFWGGGCQSVHDIVRYCHETAVAAMFRLGDAVARSQRRVRRLHTKVPLNLWLLDLGGALPPERAERRVAPEAITSEPFQALWRGMTRQGVTWTGRTNVSLAGFASVLSATMHDAHASVRELGGANYLLVARDYVSLNARLAYHFAMIDALVGEVAENNFVNFRFRGGAAGVERRDLRARFLAEVLLRSGFGVDRRGDLVTAWMRRFGAGPSLAALELLGALLGCARQLDMLMSGDDAVQHFVARFLAGDYASFG